MRHPATLLFAKFAEPPLPSPDDATIDRTGIYSRQVRGPGGAFIGRDVVPLWIADMEFAAPRPVIDAVVERARHGVYGYTDCPPELTEATIERLSSVYGSAVPPEASWFRWLPGLVPGLNHAVRAWCAHGSGDAVAVTTPIYPPFLAAAANNGARLHRVPLAEVRSGAGSTSSSLRYEIDWAAMEAALAAPETKLLLWCNPHNPTGRCWSRAEMARLAALCVANDVALCSDEVWGEVPLEAEAAPFTSALALLDPTEADGAVAAADGGGGAGPAKRARKDGGVGASAGSAGDDSVGPVPGLLERLVVLTSPSKCFNVASLDVALAVVPHAPSFARFRGAGRDAAEVTPLGYAACLAAYAEPEAEAWRQRLLAYLRANRDLAAAVLGTLPGVRATTPEASYLMWIDATDAVASAVAELSAGHPSRAKGRGPVTAAEHLLAHGVGLSAGEDFGTTTGFARLNLACTRATLERGLERICEALGEPLPSD